MKKYPRLHSLSTIGIIHHQDNDYQFHPMRTDFIGDSASGKSIIADLLQLIFVGSSAFRSATIIMKGKREPDGLVLRTSGKGIDIAYALINIEVANEQYIAIGAYFESSSKQTKPFIIQASTKIEDGKLTPIQTPLKSSDLKYEGDVCSLEELPELMESKGLIFKKWDKINPYHRILYFNNILPLDLAASEKILTDYAKIIQSFSRGKTLDTRDSKSLLDFLFGKDSGKEIFKKYLDIVRDLESTVISYGQNQNAINLLNRKYEKVRKLRELLVFMKENEKKYLHEELLLLQNKFDRLNSTIRNNIEKYQIASHSLNVLIQVAENEVGIANDVKNNIDNEVELALDKYTKAKSRQDLLIKGQRLLSTLNIQESELNTFYNEYHLTKKRNIILNEFISKLSDEKLVTFFELSEWMNGFVEGNTFYVNRLNEIKIQLEQYDLLIKFSNVNDPQSLVRWALSLNKSLSLDEESLVTHFQTYERDKPDNPIRGERFLPLPEILFKNEIIGREKNGFWFDLGGLNEFIEYVPEQKLNTVNKSRIEDYFKKYTTDILQLKDQLEIEQKNLINLNKILFNLSNPSGTIIVYQQKELLKEFKEILELEIGNEEFQSLILSLQHHKEIQDQFDTSKKAYDHCLKIKVENDNIIKKLPSLIMQSKRNMHSKNGKASSVLNQKKERIIKREDDYDLSFYINSSDKIETFRNECDKLKEDIELVDQLEVVIMEFDEISKTLKQKLFNFINRYEIPSLNHCVFATEKSVHENNVLFTTSLADYKAEFNTIVDEFILNEKYRFENSWDFAELISYLLPDIFANESIIEEEVVTKINAYLNKINDKNRELNSKKIRKIENLLDDLRVSISNQADVVRKINHFFNADEKKITGNHRLQLEFKYSERFPIKWLTDFKIKSSDQLQLFNDTLVDKLSFSISIEEKIINAFQELTEQRGTGITIEQLLDPNSYIELNLEMQNSSGKSNKGSTGQTYAAIALLCIARLSIVGNRKIGKTNFGIRFMPIDEAEGLGTNFDMLNDIAQKYDYQTITFSINPLGRYDDQFIYILHQNPDIDNGINFTPVAVFSKVDIKDNLLKIKRDE